MTSVEPLLFGGRSHAAWDLAQAKLRGSGRIPQTLPSLGLGRNPVSQIREGMFLLVIRHETKPKQKPTWVWGGVPLATRSALWYLNLGKGAWVGLSLSWVCG